MNKLKHIPNIINTLTLCFVLGYKITSKYYVHKYFDIIGFNFERT